MGKELVTNFKEEIPLKGKRKGFTLIELLVVVAIIAILAALLFPVFSAAREKGRLSACTSNLKQIHLGFQSYLQDWDETFPIGWNGWQGRKPHYKEVIKPYVKSEGVFLCPSDRGTTFSQGKPAYEAWGSTYNYHNVSWGYGDQGLAERSLGDIRSSAEAMLMWDADFFHMGVTRLDPTIEAYKNKPGRLNVLWVDGHLHPLTSDQWREAAVRSQ